MVKGLDCEPWFRWLFSIGPLWEVCYQGKLIICLLLGQIEDGVDSSLAVV
jgi:hypothetical protein